MSVKAPRIIYLSHLQMAIIGEEVAREGMGEVLDHLSRNYQMRTDFYLVVAKGETARTVLSILTPWIKSLPRTCSRKLKNRKGNGRLHLR
ncbi:hypothetical protein LJK87_13625 [Paenibacillus sp. P25]|nr:hypothetical protein LJK87_13625 [Paenibacillus sp. P25]